MLVKSISENTKVSSDIVKLLYIAIYVDCLLMILLIKHTLQFNNNVHIYIYTSNFTNFKISVSLIPYDGQ
jgi:hypothetical protein